MVPFEAKLRKPYLERLFRAANSDVGGVRRTFGPDQMRANKPCRDIVVVGRFDVDFSRSAGAAECAAEGNFDGRPAAKLVMIGKANANVADLGKFSRVVGAR